MRKNIVAILLVLALCLSLCACGSKMKAEDEIVGMWTYDTPFTTWTFVFEADNTCTYWSGVIDPKDTTYTMDDGELVVDNLDWEFHYELLDDGLDLWHTLDSGTEWHFVKNVE